MSVHQESKDGIHWVTKRKEKEVLVEKMVNGKPKKVPFKRLHASREYNEPIVKYVHVGKGLYKAVFRDPSYGTLRSLD